MWAILAPWAKSAMRPVTRSVGLLDGVVRGHRAVHAHHPQRQGRGLGEGAQAHEGGADGDVVGLGDGAQERAGAGDDGAAADVEHGAMGLVDGVGQAGDLRGRRLDGGVVGPHRDVLHVGLQGDGLLDVLRDVDEDGAGLAGGGDEEGLGDDARDLVHRAHQVVVLGDAAGDARVVGLLEGVRADESAAHLAGDDDQRHAVHHGGGQAGHGVGGAGAGGDDGAPHAARGAGVTVGHVDAALLMAREHHAQRRTVELVEEVDGRAARIPEDDLDAVVEEAVDDALCAGAALRRLIRGHASGVSFRLT